MTTKVILDHGATLERISSILTKYEHKVGLDNLEFIGAVPGTDTITTLPSTFPEGDYRYKVCTTVKKGKREGKRLIDIVSENSFTYRSAESYYGSKSCRAVNAVEKAENSWIMPFSFKNEHINNLLVLYSMAFWTGCVNYGYVEVNPCQYNKDALDRCLGGLGNLSFSVHNDVYYITDTSLSRELALLGLPLQQGKKASIRDFNMPWFVDFMFGNHFKDDSMQRIEEFRKIFLYSLLSDRTRNIRCKDSLGVNLIGSRTKIIGERMVKKVAEQFMMTFNDMQLSDNDFLTDRVYKNRPPSKQRFENRIYLRRQNMHTLIKSFTGKFDYESLPHVEVKRLAGQELCGFL